MEVLIKLTPTISIPAVLYVEPPLSIKELLTVQSSNPPGKIYDEVVLSCLSTSGYSSRIVLGDTTNDTQREYFMKLKKLLQSGKLVSYFE